MGEERSSQFGTLLVTGLLAILGTVAGGVIKGYWDTRLADKKFQSDLVMRALEADEQASRIASLDFMIKTNLITDPEIKHGVENVLAESPETVPQIRPAPLAYNPGVVIPRTEQTVGFTDYKVFVCDGAPPSGAAAANSIIEGLDNAGRRGQMELETWSLYDEIPREALLDKTTIVVDMEHGEAQELPRLKRILSQIDGLQEIQVVDNSGRTTPWFISLIVCPSQ